MYLQSNIILDAVYYPNATMNQFKFSLKGVLFQSYIEWNWIMEVYFQNAITTMCTKMFGFEIVTAQTLPKLKPQKIIVQISFDGDITR